MASGSRPASGLALGSRPSSAVSSRWTDDAYEADADVAHQGSDGQDSE